MWGYERDLHMAAERQHLAQKVGVYWGRAVRPTAGGGRGGGGKQTAMTWGCSCCYAVCVVVHQ